MTPPNTLSETVETALEAQRRYEQARATRLGRGAERLTAPLGGLIGQMIPPDLVRQGLSGADRLAGQALAQVPAHDSADLAACESAALRVQAWAVGANAASGGVTGAMGGAGFALDVPATIMVAAASVRATGTAYGFGADSADERAFRLMLLELATTEAGRQRETRIEDLRRLAGWLSTPEARVALETGGGWLADKLAERLTRALGLSLAKRKAGQVVPVLGGAVGALVNAGFQTDVARAARYGYRMRWLMARKLVPGPAAEQDSA